jgi:adenosylmethionine-8-amino-7-oxononanoate aminotransferase
LLLAGPLTDVRRIEQFWRRAFAGLPNVRIQGTIAAIEVEAPGGYLSDVGQTMRRRCLEQGVFLRPLGNVLYALPPYCTSDESLERIAEAMMAAMGLFK